MQCGYAVLGYLCALSGCNIWKCVQRYIIWRQVRELAAARKQLAELQAEAKATDEAATALEEQCGALREAITAKGAEVQRRGADCACLLPCPTQRWTAPPLEQQPWLTALPTQQMSPAGSSTSLSACAAPCHVLLCSTLRTKCGLCQSACSVCVCAPYHVKG